MSEDQKEIQFSGYEWLDSSTTAGSSIVPSDELVLIYSEPKCSIIHVYSPVTAAYIDYHPSNPAIIAHV